MTTREIKIRDIKLGGNNNIVVQTMCNTPTADIEKSVLQCLEAYKAGADIIRLTTQGIKEVEALKEIKLILKEKMCNIPLVADVHFNSEIAIAAAKVADKVRINPGNFAKDFQDARSQFKRFISICKEYGTAIRIGLNHGSLGERITNLYGNTPEGMKEAALEWINMCIANNFYNVVVSLKASNTLVMTDAYRLLKRAMEENNINFPLHLGVTEAGNSDTGRIKSSVGIGSLLKDRIGDTIRVSLTENPVNEIYAGKCIANYYQSGKAFENSEYIESQIKKFQTPCMNYNVPSWNEFIIKASCDFGPLLLNKTINDFNVQGTINGVDIEQDKIDEYKDNLMQASRRKFSKPEYIACPGCGRTLYDLEKTFNEVKRRTSHLKGIKIAVMGCIVNGPGEMADADYGYVGEGVGKVAIYKGKEVIRHSVPQREAIDALLEIIDRSTIMTNDLAQ